MKKEAQVVMLPSLVQTYQVKQGDVFINDSREHSWGKLQALKCERVTSNGHAWNGSGIQTYINHLYLVDDSEIKEGDWYLLGKIVRQSKGNLGKPDKGKYMKIIGTTDSSLVINAVDIHEVQGQVMQSHYHKELPQLSQSFIESYCKNPVEKVMVEYETPVPPLKMRRSNSGKAKMLAIKQAAFGLQPQLTHNNELIIHPIEEKLYTREEVAELCAKAYWDGNLNTGDIIPENWIKENL